MRLKFLFFPIILLISIILFVLNIWPAIGELRAANTDKMKKEATLQEINNKQLAANKLTGLIDGDSEGEKIINNYLPNTKAEEKILTNVNFLANDSSVSLLNITLNDKSAANASSDATLYPQNPESMGGNGMVTQAGRADEIQNTEATIFLSGEYEKIKLFLDGLQHLPMFNSVLSLDIASQAATAKTEEAQKNANNLSVTIVANFGYLKPIKMSSQLAENFNPTIDKATIDVLKQYVNQKSPAVSVSKADKKNNPFAL